MKGELESPQASKGTLCIYTGQESITGEFTSSVANVKGVVNETSLQGARIAFEPKETQTSNNIVTQGTWAVTEE